MLCPPPDTLELPGSLWMWRAGLSSPSSPSCIQLFPPCPSRNLSSVDSLGSLSRCPRFLFLERWSLFWPGQCLLMPWVTVDCHLSEALTGATTPNSQCLHLRLRPLLDSISFSCTPSTGSLCNELWGVRWSLRCAEDPVDVADSDLWSPRSDGSPPYLHHCPSLGGGPRRGRGGPEAGHEAPRDEDLER